MIRNNGLKGSSGAHPRKILHVKSVPASMVTIKAAHDFFVLTTSKTRATVFFMRDVRGGITAIWAAPDVQVDSFGSAKERRALFARRLRKTRSAAAEQRNGRSRRAGRKEKERRAERGGVGNE
jgi:hypothetical protein